MFKIYIDTAERYAKSVKLIDGSGSEIASAVGDIDVAAEIKTMLMENELAVEDIEIVEVNKGPGSFTGLKIGVTIANVLNWALGRKKLEELVHPEYGSEPNIQKKAD